VNAQILVSPAEVNSRVIPCARYNMNRINPAQDVYWDSGYDPGSPAGNSPTGFLADLTTQSNTSYGTMPLDPALRRKVEWRNSGNARFAILGNRGPKGGTGTGNDFTQSKTLLIHGSTKEWDGNTCYNDNHVDFGRTFYPESVTKLAQDACAGGTSLTGAEARFDNMFKNDTFCVTAAGRRNSDSWLVLQKRSPNESNQAGTAVLTTWDGPSPDFTTWD
jgi:hypothetical protein